MGSQPITTEISSWWSPAIAGCAESPRGSRLPPWRACCRPPPPAITWPPRRPPCSIHSVSRWMAPATCTSRTGWTAGSERFRQPGSSPPLPATAYRGITATAAAMLGPTDCVSDSAGNLYITDRGNSRIRRVSPTGTISTFAGNGTAGYSGDGGLAIEAEIFQPFQLAIDAAGNLYIADWGNSRVRKITPAGIITTVAGGGPNYGPPGDGGLATAATIGGNLYGIAVDSAGNLYITS